MDAIVKGFLERNLPQFADRFQVELDGGPQDAFTVTAADGIVRVRANNYISAFHGIYTYLKTYCNVQLSWCGNREIRLEKLCMFDGALTKRIEQKYRVYMNYCTLDYSMCWWDFDRWEKEIDFMAMNGINMPLAVVGSEAVWYETLLEFGFTDAEALQTISGPAFWAWQLMTNIEGYLPPSDERYVYQRLELGKRILQRYIEFGMQPIQQGFSGHVPVKLKEKYPKAHILMQRGWCLYPKTAQLDPLDPLFHRFGSVYLHKLQTLFGNYHYIACDPFHEGTPPKKGKKYLNEVGRAIDRLYAEFDPQSVWVMQAWSLRKHIVQAVPKDRLLILDLNSKKTAQNDNMWGYAVVAGMLHNYGGKNAMQGKLAQHSENAYLRMKRAGVNVVGSGMFMEGIEQNPVLYDLQFELLTTSERIDLSAWLDAYISRRYGHWHPALRQAWDLLLETCYASNDRYRENEVGSALASRPQMNPVKTGPRCNATVFYDVKKFEQAVALFASVHSEFHDSDGYQYDLCDLTRQAMSNRFYTRQQDFAHAYRGKNIAVCEKIAGEQLDLLCDLDALLSHRSELCLSRWINGSHCLAENAAQRRYFDFNARTLLTLWGDIRSNTSALYDYAWREWSGLIREYYYVRWKMFYRGTIQCLREKRRFPIINGNGYVRRYCYRFYPFGKRLSAFELKWGRTYSEYPDPVDSDVIPAAIQNIEKWQIGKKQ